MKRRGVPSKALAAQIGVAPQTFSRYRWDRVVPSPPLVAEIADILDAPELCDYVHAARGQECPECHRTFMRSRRAPSWMRFCSKTCKDRWWRREQRAVESRGKEVRLQKAIQRELAMGDRLHDATKEIEARQAALDRFCRSCSGALCRTPACEWRPWSRVPLAKEAVA